MDPETFTYQPRCSAPGCDRPAAFKIASVWTDGTTRELKPYGMACEAHRDLVLESARDRQIGLRLIETETIEPVGVYHLLPGVRDSKLTRL